MLSNEDEFNGQKDIAKGLLIKLTEIYQLQFNNIYNLVKIARTSENTNFSSICFQNSFSSDDCKSERSTLGLWLEFINLIKT